MSELPHSPNSDLKWVTQSYMEFEEKVPYNLSLSVSHKLKDVAVSLSITELLDEIPGKK